MTDTAADPDPTDLVVVQFDDGHDTVTEHLTLAAANTRIHDLRVAEGITAIILDESDH